MTPEQKAWFEYGRSRGWLKAHRSKKYFADVPDMGLSFWHMQRNMCGLNALIRDTWRKRAACRAWMSLKERNCKNCMHLHRDMKSGSLVFVAQVLTTKFPITGSRERRENEHV